MKQECRGTKSQAAARQHELGKASCAFPGRLVLEGNRYGNARSLGQPRPVSSHWAAVSSRFVA